LGGRRFSAAAGVAAAVFAAIAPLWVSCSAYPERFSERRAAVLAAYPPERPFPNSSFADLGGARLHFAEWKPDPARFPSPLGNVLLVHGLGGSVYSWRFLGPALAAAGYRTLAADYPPFGYSGPCDDRGKDTRSRAALLWELLDLEGGGEWALVGHSLGGRVACRMALERPASARALVLVAPAVYAKAPAASLARLWPVGPLVSAWTGKALLDPERLRPILERAYGRPPSEDELDGYWAPFLRPGAPEAVAAWAREAVEPPLELGSLDLPALVLWGSDDRIVKEEGERILGDLAGSRLVLIEGGGHCVMETESGRVGEAVLEFLEGLDPDGAD
jgi:pimeloyl-ACP methyl ester carboxylesterase